MDDIVTRVKEFICLNKLIYKGDIVGCALSGGADSIFMVDVLNKLSREMDFKIIGIHINHMLRGEDSYLDEEFSERFCRDNNIEFRSYKRDVLEYSNKNKLSIEMGGREVRYKVFSSLRDENIINKCALAHHADDDVETIIMRIFRGTGTDGIEGIKPIRDNFYIRPILFLRRVSEIENYLNKRNISFIIDKSNLSYDYLRNKIRLSIIPNINESFSIDISKNILSLKEICKYDNDFFDKLVNEYIEKFIKRNYKKVIIHKEAFNLHQSILYRLIRKGIFFVRGDMYNIKISHIREVVKLSKKGNGRVIQLKKDLFCRCIEEGIEILTSISMKDTLREEVILLNYEEINDLKNGRIRNIEKTIKFLSKTIKVILNMEENRNLNFTSRYEKNFSIDNLKSSIVIRNRKLGDRFKPYGMNREKKLKDFLINEKVSNRDDLPLICFDNTIVWVFGVRNSDDYKILEDSLNIVKIKLEVLGDDFKHEQ